jgi:heme exporter protein B
MSSYSHIKALVQKDILLEVRQQYSFYGIVLYVASTIFVIYLSMGQPEDAVWNGLFWITQLFICVNAVAKSFLQESKGRMLYFYSIAGARDFVLSKLVFNALLMLAMNMLSLLLFTVLLGNPFEYASKFIGISILGGIGFSLLFTFLAAIAAKAQQQAALMAIMGFPVIIPQILLLMKLSGTAFSSVVQAGMTQMILLLIALDIMVVILAVILFPFLWKD